MISNRKCFALFCDDVREEKSGQSTLVGVYGPRIVVDKFPHRIRQICIVVGVRYESSEPFEGLCLKFSFPNDDDPIENIIEPDELDLEKFENSEGKPTIVIDGAHLFRGVPIRRPGNVVVSGKLKSDEEFEEFGFLEVFGEEYVSMDDG